MQRELTREEQIQMYAEVYARNLIMYGVDVSDKLESAVQLSAALNQAYLRGRQDECNRRWIPCSERLPDTEENKNYLVCGSKGGTYIAEFVCKTIDGKTDIGPWWSARGRYCPNPIAWQPLPESYKEVGGMND